MNVVVSGTSSGIGKAIARLFLERGHAVWGFDVCAATLEHERYTHVLHDVRDGAFPSIPAPQVVVVNAGTLEEADALDVNLKGAMRFCEHFVVAASDADDTCATAGDKSAPAVAGAAGNKSAGNTPNNNLRSVLFIASASARNGAEFPQYVASKAGLVGYMKNLALKVAARGVTCNSISPGGVVTPANAHILNDPALYAAVKDETLLGKWAEAEEIADLAYFLTVTNRSITGEDILVDNGEMLKSNFIW